MIGSTKAAKRLLPFFEAVARRARLDAQRVKLFVSAPEKPAPASAMTTVTIVISEGEPAQMAKALLRELKRAQDRSDGSANGLSLSDREERAKTGETLISDQEIAAMITHYQTLFERS